MSVRNNSKHIPEFALAPVRYFIHTSHGRDMRFTIFERDSQLQRKVSGQRRELVDDLKTRGYLRPVIDRRHRRKQFEIILIAQESQCLDDVSRFQEHMHFASELFEGHVKFFLQSLNDCFEFFIHRYNPVIASIALYSPKQSPRNDWQPEIEITSWKLTITLFHRLNLKLLAFNLFI